MQAGEALRTSKAMMDGYKWKLLRLQLRFACFALLCLLTLGIGFLWLIPYSYVTLAKFYDDIRPVTEPDMTQVIADPVARVVVVYVALLVPTLLPFTFH